MADRTLTVKIIGDESDLLRSFRRSTTATQRFSASFGTFLKGAVIFEGVRAGIDAIGGALRAGADEFSQMQTVAAQTGAVLKSTGGVANVAASGVERLAERLSRLSGVDDEAIASAENLILTFKNVRNELGDGNRIFDRTTAAALDLSKAAGGAFGSLDSSAKQLAKALNDPIRGMTALGRAGVTFTESQRDTIKALVESNRLLDAQKLILREVESQVGGSARAFGETLPGQLSKVREAFRNAFGNLVGVVAQPLATALGAFADFVPKIEAGVERISGAVGPALNDLVDTFVGRLPELRRIIGSILDPLRENVLPILEDFAAVARRVWGNVVEVFDQNRQSIRGILKNLGETLAAVWTLARPTIVFLFEKALPAALNIAIPIIEKLTAVTRVLAQTYVRVVGIIIAALDKFLGGLTSLTDAASHLPFIGDKFVGISDRVNEAREGLRGFGASLDALDGKQVRVSVAVDVSTGRREEGALGRQADETKDLDDEVNKQIRGLEDAFKAQEQGARRVQTAAVKATAATRTAISAAEKQRLERERLRQAAETRREQRRSRQFERLGLTATGDTRVPGVSALRTRLGNVSEQIKGTILDTEKTKRQLGRIAKVLSGQFGKVGRDVRQSILQMLNDIASALGGDAAGSAGGPLTKTSGLNTKKILQGLGLSEEQVRELRGRLSSVNTAGRQLAVVGAPAGSGRFREGGFGNNPIFLESTTTINLDGQQVAKVVTKQQQKTRRRNPQQKRGPNRNR